jgi:CubicO group peptidase (beta-lactamase class C family)
MDASHRARALAVAAGCLALMAACTGAPAKPPTPSTLPLLLPEPSVAAVPAPSSPPDPIAPGLAATLDAALADDDFERLLSLVILVDGRPVYERAFGSLPTDRHNVSYATSSVVGLLVGIAIDEGLIDGVDATLGELLPQYAEQMSPAMRKVTLEQLLTHRAVRDAPSPLDDGPPAPDWVAAALAAQPAEPDGEFRYANGDAHLLSAILARATGGSVLDYARRVLFDPLGIDTSGAEQVDAAAPGAQLDGVGFAWAVDPQGLQLGSTGLRLTARDMARIGQLVLQRGRWEGRQLVSPRWIRAATRPHVKVNDAGDGYGYQWWTGVTDKGERTTFALGIGGQVILVVPALRTVVAYQIWRPVSEKYDNPAVSELKNLVALTALPAIRAGAASTR